MRAPEPRSRHERNARASLVAGAFVAFAAFATAACSGGASSGAGGASGVGGVGAASAWEEGSTGALNSELNVDIQGPLAGTGDCGPDSLVDASGACQPACSDLGGRCFDWVPDLQGCADGSFGLEAWDCGVCCPPEADPTCTPGSTCQPCSPDEADSDGDGEIDPDCEPEIEPCGDDVCDATVGENCMSCEIDCGGCPRPTCGDSICDRALGEDCANCNHDCPVCPTTPVNDGYCDPEGGENCESSDDCGTCFRVLTWDATFARNRGTSAKRVKKTVRAMGTLLRAKSIDLAAIQSVEQHTERTDELNMPGTLGKHARMFVRYFKGYQANGGSFGVAVLAKHKYRKAARYDLPDGNEYARRVLGAATVELTNGPLLTFAVSKLSVDTTAHPQQARKIASALGTNASAVLGMNLVAGAMSSAAHALLIEETTFVDPWPEVAMAGDKGRTYEGKRFDVVFAGGVWQPPEGATRGRTFGGRRLSSHKPVLMVFNRQDVESVPPGSGGGPSSSTSSSTSHSSGASTSSSSSSGGSSPPGPNDLCRTSCDTDSDCATNECGYRLCIDDVCKDCRSNADCADPDMPRCGGDDVCF